MKNKKEVKKLNVLWRDIQKKSTAKNSYWLTRFLFLRVLGVVYFFAFLSLATQVIPLIGEEGLLPAKNFISLLGERFEDKIEAFKEWPTLFWFNASDNLLLTLSWLGVLLSLIVVFGYANSILLTIIWFLYMSFYHIGQLWYGYGWEIQLLETGFLAIFIVPLLDWRPFPKTIAPVPIIWLLRWLAFRIHIGSGLIKIRGSECWKKLTCLYYHYETQPIPNPLSPYFHFLPKIIHKLGVLFSHFVQIFAPFSVFGPKLIRNLGGVLMLLLQVILILSGNLSFLNWITIAAIIGYFDDSFLRRFMPKRLVKKADKAEKNSKIDKRQQVIALILVVLVVLSSVPIVKNLFSERQRMNASFNQWHLVNTYGAFGGIGKERYELIIEGTDDEILNENTKWKEYEFKAKPGDVNRKLPLIAPYQPRIDWQIWFAAMSNPDREPWLIHFVWKLLNNDENTLKLISHSPFQDEPPKYIRIEYYKYEFAPLRDKEVWRREHIGHWLPRLSKDNTELQVFIKANNWKKEY